MFQFISITYNHEKYILEHLESVKYQVESYGLKEAILTICDDHSTDRTLELVEKWLTINGSIFAEAKVFRNDENRGVVYNYLRAVKEIKNNKFKILAGDDLYYSNPIKEALKEYDFVATRVISFSDNMRFELSPGYSRSIDSVEKVRQILKYSNPFFAPGVFMKKELIQDKLLIEHISMFKWIEDFPSWQYLFMIREADLSYKSTCIPYIMYRSDVGIFGNRNASSEKSRLFLLEVEKMHQYYGVNKKNRPICFAKYLNPKNYIRKIAYLLGFSEKENKKIVVDVKRYYSLIKEYTKVYHCNSRF